MGCWGAEAPAPEYGSDLPHRPMEDERDKQTFLFGLWAQPGSHDRRHPAPQARMGASPTPIADAGRAFSQPHDPLRPPAASDWRIPSCLTPNVTLSPSPLSLRPTGLCREILFSILCHCRAEDSGPSRDCPTHPLGVPGVSHLESCTPAARRLPQTPRLGKSFRSSRESFLTREK